MNRDLYILAFILFVTYNSMAVFSFINTESYTFVMIAILLNCWITFILSRRK